MKQTKQGLRDLGGNTRQRQALAPVGCNHSWTTLRQHDGWQDRVDTSQRCELCGEVRS